MMADVLLLNYPFLSGENESNRFTHLGLLSLATVCQNAGIQSVVLDVNEYLEANLEYGRVLEVITRYNAKIVGFSTICSSYSITLKLASLLKQLRPDILIVLGGPQASLTAKETLEVFSFIDFIVTGEAENSFLMLVKNILSNTDNFSNISGLYYRDKKNAIIQTLQHVYLKNLDELPMLDFSLLHSKQENFQHVILEVGRGCPYGCSFCSTRNHWGNRYRMFSTDRLIEQMLFHYEKGVRVFDFEHDNLSSDRAWLVELCNKIIQTKMEIKWYASSRIDRLDGPLINLMVKSGCAGIFLGIESGSNKVQRLVNKNLKIDESLINKVELLVENNVDVTVSFIVGFIEESAEDLKDTLKLIFRFLKCGVKIVQVHPLNPVAGSDMMKKHSDRLVLVSNHVSTSFSLELDKTEFDVIKQHKNIFSTYYAYSHPIFSQRFITNIVAFARTCIVFRTTVLLFSESLNDYFLDVLLKNEEVLSPISMLERRDYDGLVAVTKSCLGMMVNCFDLKYRNLIQAIIEFEYMLYVVQERKVNRNNPMSFNSNYPVHEIINYFESSKNFNLSSFTIPVNRLHLLLWVEGGRVRMLEINDDVASFLEKDQL